MADDLRGAGCDRCLMVAAMSDLSKEALAEAVEVLRVTGQDNTADLLEALAARVAKMSAVLRDQASLSRDLREAANMHNAADWMDTLAARVAELEAERDEALNQLDSARHSIDVLEKRAAEFMARAETAEVKLAASREEGRASLWKELQDYAQALTTKEQTK